MHKTLAAILFLIVVSSPALAASAPAWSAKKANEWYASQPLLVGSNFIPSTAINELEMWQAETFDLPTIERGSTFAAILPLLKAERVGAYSWGFVNGKSQTIYPWDSWDKAYKAEPAVWFHDIFRKDGSPYDPNEVALIKQLTH